MNDPLQPTRCARMLAALAAPDRLRLVRHLQEGPRTVSELAGLMKTSLVNVSHHLIVLRRAGIVRSKRKGRFMIYSLPPGVFQPDGGAANAEHLNLGCCRIEIPRADG